MALIKCPECGKEVSDKSKKCPNCGVGLAGMQLMKMKISVVIFIISIIITIGCSIYISNNEVDAARESLDNFTLIGTEYYKEDDDLPLNSKINLSKNIRTCSTSTMIISLICIVIFYIIYNNEVKSYKNNESDDEINE